MTAGLPFFYSPSIYLTLLRPPYPLVGPTNNISLTLKAAASAPTCIDHIVGIITILMIMIIFIHKKDTLQIMVTNKQQSPNLRMPVESYKKLIWLHERIIVRI